MPKMTKDKTENFSLRLDNDLYAYIEANKGNMNRSQYINYLLRKVTGL